MLVIWHFSWFAAYQTFDYIDLNLINRIKHPTSHFICLDSTLSGLAYLMPKPKAIGRLSVLVYAILRQELSYFGLPNGADLEGR